MHPVKDASCATPINNEGKSGVTKMAVRGSMLLHVGMAVVCADDTSKTLGQHHDVRGLLAAQMHGAAPTAICVTQIQ